MPREVPEIVEQRSRLLSRNAELKALYVELVNGGVVAEDEFWKAQRVDDVITAMKMTAGFESAMATDDQASSGGANTLVHTLTSLKMRQIFFENPNLERLWKEQVPHQVRAAFRNCPLHLSWRVRAAAQTGACRSWCVNRKAVFFSGESTEPNREPEQNRNNSASTVAALSFAAVQCGVV